MQLKTFRGNSMATALCAVKKELGKDAVIVHTRTFKIGGVMGVGGKEVVEVIAAIENNAATSPGRTGERTGASVRRQDMGADRNNPLPLMRPTVATRNNSVRVGTVAGHSGSLQQQATTAVVGAKQTLLSRSDVSAPQLMRVRKRLSVDPVEQSETQAAALGQATSFGAHRVESGTFGTPSEDQSETSGRGMRNVVSRVIDGRIGAAIPESHDVLTGELGAIKAMLGELMQSRSGASASLDAPNTVAPDVRHAGAFGTEYEGPLVQHYQELLSHHVSRELVERILVSVRSELTLVEQRSVEAVRGSVLRHLGELVPTSDTSLTPFRRDGAPGCCKPFTIALVGPTGVGKTTTIAKLAAAYKLRQGRRVGLVTTDTYRVGAIEQLSTYAAMIGVPLKVAANAAEMQATCDEFIDMDIVLIDTAGRSPRDGSRLCELRAMLDAAAPDETHLVLSSTASEPAMLEAADRFGAVGTSRVIFTKLDEAVTYGVIFNVAQQLGTRLSFITTGQEVPDQIEATNPERLARLMLGAALFGGT